jgi:ubiquinone/menaquinone biosynthesis C-methylase UbiE
MIQDLTNQQIEAIQTLFDLRGKTVLEIGCGKGRVTRDLSKLADKIIATDPNAAAIECARKKIVANNIKFIDAPSGIPELPLKSVDLVIYTLSLHHVPATEMQSSLLMAGALLKTDGAILVLEPADGGSFNQAKTRFGVGSGDEGPLKAAALTAMQNLPGWEMGKTCYFMTEFLFTDENDFLTNKLPHFVQLQAVQQQEFREFLHQHRTAEGIILSSERRLDILRPVPQS